MVKIWKRMANYRRKVMEVTHCLILRITLLISMRFGFRSVISVFSRYKIYVHCYIGRKGTGTWFNIKMWTHQYRKSHCENKITLQNWLFCCCCFFAGVGYFNWHLIKYIQLLICSFLLSMCWCWCTYPMTVNLYMHWSTICYPEGMRWFHSSHPWCVLSDWMLSQMYAISQVIS